MSTKIQNGFFPSIYDPKKDNPHKSSISNNIALEIFGNRFYSDQTVDEYLSEFLLVFNSPKLKNKDSEPYGSNSLSITYDTGFYRPKTRLGLKFFSFFSQSKLETRHSVHHEEFLNALELVKSKMDSYITDEEKNDLVQILQSLLYGFIGIAKNRTWATYNFLPISPMLLGREVTWRHTTESFNTWQDSLANFHVGDHRFMARGGEVLFLQLGHLFSNIELHQSLIRDKILNKPQYTHLEFNLNELQTNLEDELVKLLKTETNSIERICKFIDNALKEYDISEADKRPATLARIPDCYVFEAFLFANELLILLRSNISKLEKVEFLQILCVMQVLRSIMARSRQLDVTAPATPGFHANYAWIACSPNSTSSDPIRKHAESSYQKNEEIIYRVLRAKGKERQVQESDYVNIDGHSLNVFKKMAKAIGLVIPINGGHQRFVLNANLTRLFVYTLIPDGQRIQINELLSRIYTHFSISIFGDQLQEAMSWQYEQLSEPTTDIKLTWFEESLRQSGLLIELSDSISIVKNP
ncbi:MAG TPA: hypothetical protein VIG45_02990 [Erysipelothrix sp.]